MKMLFFFFSWFVFAILSVGILLRPAYGFNHDEYADIVWHNRATGQNLSWFMNQTNRSANGFFTNDMGADWHIVATADFDRDSYCDLLWRNETTGANAIWFMSATNRTSQTAIQDGDTNWYVVGVYDFDGDGWNDIVWRRMTGDKTAVWYMNYTNFVTSKLIPYSAGPTWRASAVADCNNDGFGDIIWRETSGAGRVSIWFMQNTNRLSEVMVDQSVPDQTFQLIAAGPLNRLGNTDFLWQKDNFMNYVWLMASNHFYYSARLPDTGPDWEIGGIGGYRDYLHQMLLTAMVDPSAASILLNWRYGEERPVIQRKGPSSLTWTTLLTTACHGDSPTLSMWQSANAMNTRWERDTC